MTTPFDKFRTILINTKTSKALARAWGVFIGVVRLQPFTFRGAAALLLGVFAIKELALKEADLIAAVLGGTILFLLAATVTMSFILSLRLRWKLLAEPHFDPAGAFSRTPVGAGITLRNSGIAPYFSLTVSRRFTEQGAVSKSHLLTGHHGPTARRHLVDTVLFPHRGLWELDSLRFSLEDALGFTRRKWEMPAPASIEVSAPTIQIAPLPFVAASSRSGDELSLTQKRSGDLFDIKPYDPSDGITRILWKTYAKSRELVVRRPEPAVVPEGEVALYLVAGRDDDHVAGAAQGYIEQLQEQNITILFGTDGIVFDSPPATSSLDQSASYKRFCIEAQDIQRAINRSAWSSEAGTAQGLDSYLESLVLANRLVHTVVVFAPSRDQQNSHHGLSSIFETASHHAIQLSLALVPDSFKTRFPAGQFVAHSAATDPLTRIFSQKIRSYLEKLGKNSSKPSALQEISRTAADFGAELVEVRCHE